MPSIFEKGEEFRPLFETQEKLHDLPHGHMSVMARIESGFNPLATNPSGARGMFQIMPRTGASLGLKNYFDAEENTKAAAKLAASDRQVLINRIGRPPKDGAEYYIMHQQGGVKGPKFLKAVDKNSDKLAIEVLGKQEVLGNVWPKSRRPEALSWTVKQYYDYWANTYNNYAAEFNQYYANKGKPTGPDKYIAHRVEMENPSVTVLEQQVENRLRQSFPDFWDKADAQKAREAQFMGPPEPSKPARDINTGAEIKPSEGGEGADIQLQPQSRHIPWYEKALDLTAMLISPLTAPQAFILAPIAAWRQGELDSNIPIRNAVDAVGIGLEAARKALFPPTTTEGAWGGSAKNVPILKHIPFLNETIIGRLDYDKIPASYVENIVNTTDLKDAHPLIKNSVILAGEVLSDPTFTPGLLTRKLMNEGLRITRLRRMKNAPGSTPYGRPMEEGLRWIMNIDDFEREKFIYKQGKKLIRRGVQLERRENIYEIIKALDGEETAQKYMDQIDPKASPGQLHKVELDLRTHFELERYRRAEAKRANGERLTLEEYDAIIRHTSDPADLAAFQEQMDQHISAHEVWRLTKETTGQQLLIDDQGEGYIFQAYDGSSELNRESYVDELMWFFKKLYPDSTPEEINAGRIAAMNADYETLNDIMNGTRWKYLRKRAEEWFGPDIHNQPYIPEETLEMVEIEYQRNKKNIHAHIGDAEVAEKQIQKALEQMPDSDRFVSLDGRLVTRAVFLQEYRHIVDAAHQNKYSMGSRLPDEELLQRVSHVANWEVPHLQEAYNRAYIDFMSNLMRHYIESPTWTSEFTLDDWRRLMDKPDLKPEDFPRRIQQMAYQDIDASNEMVRAQLGIGGEGHFEIPDVDGVLREAGLEDEMKSVDQIYNDLLRDIDAEGTVQATRRAENVHPDDIPDEQPRRVYDPIENFDEVDTEHGILHRSKQMSDEDWEKALREYGENAALMSFRAGFSIPGRFGVYTDIRYYMGETGYTPTEIGLELAYMQAADESELLSRRWDFQGEWEDYKKAIEDGNEPPPPKNRRDDGEGGLPVEDSSRPPEGGGGGGGGETPSGDDMPPQPHPRDMPDRPHGYDDTEAVVNGHSYVLHRNRGWADEIWEEALNQFKDNPELISEVGNAKIPGRWGVYYDADQYLMELGVSDEDRLREMSRLRDLDDEALLRRREILFHQVSHERDLNLRAAQNERAAERNREIGDALRSGDMSIEEFLEGSPEAQRGSGDPRVEREMISLRPGVEGTGRRVVMDDVIHYMRALGADEEDIMETWDAMQRMSDQDLLIERDSNLAQYSRMQSIRNRADVPITPQGTIDIARHYNLDPNDEFFENGYNPMDGPTGELDDYSEYLSPEMQTQVYSYRNGYPGLDGVSNDIEWLLNNTEPFTDQRASGELSNSLDLLHRMNDPEELMLWRDEALREYANSRGQQGRTRRPPPPGGPSGPRSNIIGEARSWRGEGTPGPEGVRQDIEWIATSHIQDPEAVAAIMRGLDGMDIDELVQVRRELMEQYENARREQGIQPARPYMRNDYIGTYREMFRRMRQSGGGETPSGPRSSIIDEARNVARIIDNGGPEAVEAANGLDDILEQTPYADRIRQIIDEHTNRAAEAIREDLEPGMSMDDPSVRWSDNRSPGRVASSIINNVLPEDIHINMARMNSSEDAQSVFDEMYQRYQDEFEQIRTSGHMPDEELSDYAQGVKLQDLVRHDPGPLPAPQAYALRMLNVASAHNVVRAARWAERQGTPGAILQYNKALNFHKFIMGEDIFRAAETGRSLRAYSLISESDIDLVRKVQNMVYNRTIDFHENQIRRMLASVDKPESVGDLMYQWGKHEKAFNDNIYAFYIHAILSGTITHATNFISNVAMLALRPLTSMVATIPALLRGMPQDAVMHLHEARELTWAAIESFTDAVKIATQFNRYQDTLWAQAKGQKKTALGKKFVNTKFKYPQRLFSRRQDTLGEALGGIEPGTLHYQADYMDTITPDVMKGLQRSEESAKGVSVWKPGDLLRREDFFFKVLNYRMQQRLDAVRKLHYNDIAIDGQRVPLHKKTVAWMMEHGPVTATDEMMGIRAAEYHTFQQELGYYGKLMTAAIKKTPFLRWVFPFIRTPVNLVKVGLEYTPYAIFRELYRSSLRGGKGAEFDLAMAKAAMGTGVMGSILMAFDPESITGKGETGSPLAYYNKAHGRPPYSIKIMGKWFSYEKIEPLRYVLGTVANYMTAIDNLDMDDKNNWELANEWAAATVGAFMSTAVDDNYISQLNHLILFMRQAFANAEAPPEEKKQGLFGTPLTSGMMSQYAASMVVPNFFHQINKRLVIGGFGDPVYRMAETLQEKLMARTPFLSNKLAPHRDLFGDPARIPPGLGPDIISPIQVRDGWDNDPILVELTRLQVDIPRAGNTISGVELSHNQYSEMLRMAGQGSDEFGIPPLREVLDEFMNDPFYQTELTDEGRSTMIKQLIRENRQAARGAIVESDEELLRAIEDKAELDEQLQYVEQR